MNTRPSRSLFRKIIGKSIGLLAKFFLLFIFMLLQAAVRIVRAAVLFLRRGAVVWKIRGALGDLKMGRLHAILGVS